MARLSFTSESKVLLETCLTKQPHIGHLTNKMTIFPFAFIFLFFLSTPFHGLHFLSSDPACSIFVSRGIRTPEAAVAACARVVAELAGPSHAAPRARRPPRSPGAAAANEFYPSQRVNQEHTNQTSSDHRPRYHVSCVWMYGFRLFLVPLLLNAI